MHKATRAECNKEYEAPFKPSGTRTTHATENILLNEDDNYDTQCLTCQFKEISDYLKLKEENIDVLPLSSLYKLQYN